MGPSPSVFARTSSARKIRTTTHLLRPRPGLPAKTPSIPTLDTHRVSSHQWKAKQPQVQLRQPTMFPIGLRDRSPCRHIRSTTNYLRQAPGQCRWHGAAQTLPTLRRLTPSLVEPKFQYRRRTIDGQASSSRRRALVLASWRSIVLRVGVLQRARRADRASRVRKVIWRPLC